MRPPVPTQAPVLAARALASSLPPLLVAAERVAATVAQGVHGRRRVGQGDSFWQYRPYQHGDAPGRIDWRQSAKSARTYVRETEWEAAQSVYLWRDASPGMHWHSRTTLPQKSERAGLLLLALASLLLRGGERVRLMGQAAAGGLDAMAAALEEHVVDPPSLPPPAALPAHSRVVLFSDFLSPLEEIGAAIKRMAAVPVTGTLVHVIDPAEAALPYRGRVRFRGLATLQEALVPRVETIRDAYGAAMTAQQDGLAALCRAAGWTITTHHTDAPVEAALLALYVTLSGA